MGGVAALLTAMLLAAGLRVVHLPGLAVNRARRGARSGENESDPRDAKVIAEQVMLRDDPRVMELPDELAADLRLLVSHRTVLVKETTAWINRLRDLLASIHPGLEKATDPTNKSTVAPPRRQGRSRLASRPGKPAPTGRRSIGPSAPTG
ncbi:transposase [Streptomyces sp. PSKA54]|uniref:Transposase n=1 Tax=Streptomyces himalayensis subsp. aureolus TaxID=2758039 RepID=A0A7W2CWV8_9ACTN|nr:transposase [Streptomyces himalayensis]MBA4860601.1 transposase [Streptomyces himalayensis subsp. aureolus]